MLSWCVYVRVLLLTDHVTLLSVEKRILARVNLRICSSRATMSAKLDFLFSDTSLHLIFRVLTTFKLKTKHLFQCSGGRSTDVQQQMPFLYFLFVCFLSLTFLPPPLGPQLL